MSSILTREAKLFLKNSFGFRSLAIDEVKKYNRKYFTGLAASMVSNLDRKGFTEWGRPGIRAQLLDVTTDELVMDFIIEGDSDFSSRSQRRLACLHLQLPLCTVCR